MPVKAKTLDLSSVERIEVIKRFESKYVPEPNSGCWLWVSHTSSNGYGAERYKQRQISAHRLSYALFTGPIQQGFVIRHKCDVRLCVNPDHLVIGTNDDNIRDMVSRNRTAFGTRIPSAKLNDELVFLIRLRYSEGGLIRDLANEFGVTKATIRLILLGCSWAQAKGPTTVRIQKRSRKGESNFAAKLRETHVVEIRRSFALGEPVSSLAKRFDVTSRTIYDITKKKTWVHLIDDLGEEVKK